MSTARKEEIIRKGFLKSLLEGTLEIKDLAGINIDLDMARQAYLQGIFEATKALIEALPPKIDYMSESGVLHGEDNTEVSSGTSDWVLKKTVYLALPTTAPVKTLIASGWKDGAQVGSMKVTSEVDGGGEVTRIETDLGTSETPYYSTGLTLDGEVTLKVYLKSAFTTAYNKTSKLIGDMRTKVVYL